MLYRTLTFLVPFYNTPDFHSTVYGTKIHIEPIGTNWKHYYSPETDYVDLDCIQVSKFEIVLTNLELLHKYSDTKINYRL